MRPLELTEHYLNPRPAPAPPDQPSRFTSPSVSRGPPLLHPQGSSPHDYHHRNPYPFATPSPKNWEASEGSSGVCLTESGNTLPCSDSEISGKTLRAKLPSCPEHPIITQGREAWNKSPSPPRPRSQSQRGLWLDELSIDDEDENEPGGLAETRVSAPDFSRSFTSDEVLSQPHVRGHGKAGGVLSGVATTKRPSHQLYPPVREKPQEQARRPQAPKQLIPYHKAVRVQGSSPCLIPRYQIQRFLKTPEEWQQEREASQLPRRVTDSYLQLLDRNSESPSRLPIPRHKFRLLSLDSIKNSLGSFMKKNTKDNVGNQSNTQQFRMNGALAVNVHERVRNFEALGEPSGNPKTGKQGPRSRQPQDKTTADNSQAGRNPPWYKPPTANLKHYFQGRGKKDSNSQANMTTNEQHLPDVKPREESKPPVRHHRREGLPILDPDQGRLPPLNVSRKESPTCLPRATNTRQSKLTPTNGGPAPRTAQPTKANQPGRRDTVNRQEARGSSEATPVQPRTKGTVRHQEASQYSREDTVHTQAGKGGNARPLMASSAQGISPHNVQASHGQNQQVVSEQFQDVREQFQDEQAIGTNKTYWRGRYSSVRDVLRKELHITHAANPSTLGDIDDDDERFMTAVFRRLFDRTQELADEGVYNDHELAVLMDFREETLQEAMESRMKKLSLQGPKGQ